MPIPKITRVNPLDLQKVGIGVALPFNRSNVFLQTYSTKDQIKSNLINLLLTNKGERLMNPVYGADILSFLFEPMDSSTIDTLRNRILVAISTYMPEITVSDIEFSTETDSHILYITIEYIINLSGVADDIIIQV